MSDPTPAGWSRWNDGRQPTVGERVVIRRHLAPGETSHLYTDVIGHVVEVGPPIVVRRQRDGEILTITDDDIAVLKALPPRPVRNREIRSLSWSSALGWPGTDFELVDGWLCRAGDDWSYRRDSAVPVEPWASAGELDRVRDWYAVRGLPLRLAMPERIVLPAQLALDGQPLPSERIRPERGLFLYSAGIGEFAQGVWGDGGLPGGDGESPGGAEGVGGAPTNHDGPGADQHVTVSGDVGDDWIGLYHGTADLDTERVRPALLASAALDDAATSDAEALTPGGEVGFARLETEGRLAAIARGVVTTVPDGTTRIGISSVQTAAAHRRHGLAAVVSAALARWGAQRGATEVYLHAFSDNTAGAALWEKLGMTVHHLEQHVEILD